jgi:hypothetical protein
MESSLASTGVPQNSTGALQGADQRRLRTGVEIVGACNVRRVELGGFIGGRLRHDTRAQQALGLAVGVVRLPVRGGDEDADWHRIQELLQALAGFHLAAGQLELAGCQPPAAPAQEGPQRCGKRGTQHAEGQGNPTQHRRQAVRTGHDLRARLLDEDPQVLPGDRFVGLDGEAPEEWAVDDGGHRLASPRNRPVELGDQKAPGPARPRHNHPRRRHQIPCAGLAECQVGGLAKELRDVHVHHEPAELGTLRAAEANGDLARGLGAAGDGVADDGRWGVGAGLDAGHGGGVQTGKGRHRHQVPGGVVDADVPEGPGAEDVLGVLDGHLPGRLPVG